MHMYVECIDMHVYVEEIKNITTVLYTVARR